MRKTMTGIVVSDKMQLTAVVAVTTQKIHPIIKKRYNRDARFMVHNPENAYKTGDKVVIAETKPLSRHKNWEITGYADKGQKAK
ncbi:MAG: 30S ribosomal protein S17 [Candidatus Berkelbacteria bacterium]|nr:MAG: 30S ribosomal protein S17 [Candidatus Berkelbacteria bacterium]QQG52101.1 MAG: 30S ribosomal protein S17 [Candidatus Berkelbacteria bacterium]